MRLHLGRIGTVTVLLAVVTALGAAPAQAQDATIDIPPGAVAGDEVTVTIAGSGCPSEQVDLNLDQPRLRPDEVATDAVGASFLASTTGLPDGTWSVDVSMVLFGPFTVSYFCTSASGTTGEITPPLPEPLVWTSSPGAATEPGTYTYTASGSGCPGAVVRVGAYPDPPPDGIGSFAIRVQGSAPVGPDGTWSVTATGEALAQLVGTSASYRILAVCYYQDSPESTPVLRYESQIQTLFAAPAVVQPPPLVTPGFTG